MDLDYVFVRVLRLFDGERPRLWLIGSEPLLGGARPLDVLTLRGPAPLFGRSMASRLVSSPD
jgi:hypothetical protein